MSAIISEPDTSSSIFIADGNLSVREITRDDVDDFFNIVRQPGFYYYCFDGTLKTVVEFVDQAMFHQLTRPISLRKSFMMAVVDDNIGEVIGHVTLDILDKYPDFYDLAYFTHPRYQGRGIATRASKMLILELFNKLGLSKIVATVHPDNVASRSVLRKLGFKDTGMQTEVVSTNSDNVRHLHQLDRNDFVCD